MSLPDAGLYPSEGTFQLGFVGMEERFVDVLLLLLRVTCRESGQEKSIGGSEHGESMARIWSKAVCDCWGFGPLLGLTDTQGTSSGRTFRGLVVVVVVVVVENITICLGRLLPPPAWLWGVGHGVRVFGWSLQ